jgi:hypothetical protein
MTSLATLGHTSPAPQPFDATHYATIATVIPVLYLAFVLQGTSFQQLLRGALDATRNQLHGNHPGSQPAAAPHGSPRETGCASATTASTSRTSSTSMTSPAGYRPPSSRSWSATR